MSSQYTRLPTNEEEEPPVRQPSYEDDPRFRTPKVAAWKRAALIGFIIFLFYLGYRLRMMAIAVNTEDIIVHAERYSEQHKYRPAASPIIRRRLPDGRLEVRGDYHIARTRRTEL
ncbi:hypothetical protein BS47DRAFT_423092 [Hydnum rufescens UP504]|uniref:Uncharacterized protein n=1 Tax=Hydnum rufescens UP504 TaxID=1448309 RepID=A0A9P6DY06_9AGAM|nr:hypothetical protein BS47DRAFT_423092 [Hydnum rufescens UP504]